MTRRRDELETDLHKRSAELLSEARTRAGKEYDRIVAEAEAKAGQILAHAQQKARHERELLLHDLKKQMITVSVEAAGMLLRANIDSEANKRLMEDFIAGMDVPA
jgi:F-type H+-transporting ATPase subunit b